MSYHQDWLMRQIEAIAAMLAYLLTGQKPQTVSTEETLQRRSNTDPLAQKLLALVSQGMICEAENQLFAAMEDCTPGVPEAAVQFYTQINKLTDAELEQANFSRQEILDGLNAVCSHYGIPIV